jgi:hypothetical protein
LPESSSVQMRQMRSGTANRFIRHRDIVCMTSCCSILRTNPGPWKFSKKPSLRNGRAIKTFHQQVRSIPIPFRDRAAVEERFSARGPKPVCKSVHPVSTPRNRQAGGRCEKAQGRQRVLGVNMNLTEVRGDGQWLGADFVCRACKVRVCAREVGTLLSDLRTELSKCRFGVVRKDGRSVREA